MIVFVGSNPSENYRKPYQPMHPESASGKVFHNWIDKMNLPSYSYEVINVIDRPSENNKALKKSDVTELERLNLIQKLSKATKVVSLGSFAHFYLVELGVENYCLPHPSPANRGRHKDIDADLRMCREYLFRI